MPTGFDTSRHISSPTPRVRNLPHLSNSSSSTHLSKLGLELGVFLLDLKLRARGLGIAERIDNFTFGAGEFGCALEVGEGFSDLALLEEELSHRCDSDVTFGID